MKRMDRYPEELRVRLMSGEIIDQPYWSFIRELNSYSDDQLDTTAVIDGGKKYSYRRMFREWERYAAVFSALNITEKNGSRLGLVPWKDYDSICAFYGVNMTGAGVSMIHEIDVLNPKRWDNIIEKEGITDLMISHEVFKHFPASRKTVFDIINTCEKHGIKKFIIMDTKETQRNGRVRVRSVRDLLADEEHVLFMSDLMDSYKDSPITCGSEGSKDDSVIIHTSGTTSGIHKPIPLSDRGFNESAARLLRDDRFNSLKKVSNLLIMPMTASYGLCDMLHLPLGSGGTIIVDRTNVAGLKTLELIMKYRPSIIFLAPGMIEMVSKFGITPDLSFVKFAFLGGGSIPPKAKKSINRLLKKCGSSAKVTVGYGLSEIGGAAILANPDDPRDTIGEPLSGIKVKLYDEYDNTFYDLSDGPHTGVLYLASPSVSCGRIGDEVFFELEDIDGEKYLNTYDLVELKEDGSLKVIGRMNKFFVNNEGIRFDAGLVETAVSEQPGIEFCGLVPEYNKLLHDTIPVLYVQMSEGRRNRKELIKRALLNVFIRDNRIVDTNLPSKVVITDDIPLTQTGKVDVYAIQKDETNGKAYSVKGVRRNGQLMDIEMMPIDETRLKSVLRPDSGIPEEVENDVITFANTLRSNSDPLRSPADNGSRRKYSEGSMPPGSVCPLLGLLFLLSPVLLPRQGCSPKGRRHGYDPQGPLFPPCGRQI